jgi:hypothetical protein
MDVTVKNHTQNLEVSRELGLDAELHEADMKLLALTAPVEYNNLKRADLETIKTALVTAFDSAFKSYWASGMSQTRARDLSMAIVKNLRIGLMSTHHEQFPSGASVIEEKANRKAAKAARQGQL